MINNIYYGIGPTFRSHIEKYGNPNPDDLIFDTYSYGEKLRIDGHVFNVLNPIDNIDELLKRKIIICSQDYLKIENFLSKLTQGRSLNIKVSDVILKHSSKCYNLIFSSPDVDTGGVFRLNWKNEDKKLDKICSGDIRGLAFKGKDLYGVSEYSGIGHISSKGFKLIRPIEKKNLHGMIYIEDINQFVLVETYTDSIIFLNSDTFLEHKRISLNKAGGDQHHINSICYFDGFIYFSAFSQKGVWRLGIWDDGFIGRIPIDVNSSKEVEIISTGLRQPHSVYIDNTQLAVCDSQQRTLLINSRAKAKFFGYPRGFCKVKDGCFVGSSEIRRIDNFVSDDFLFAKGGSINFISNNFSSMESVSINSSAVFDIIEDV